MNNSYSYIIGLGWVIVTITYQLLEIHLSKNRNFFQIDFIIGLLFKEEMAFTKISEKRWFHSTNSVPIKIR